MENDTRHSGGGRRGSFVRKFWGSSRKSFGRKSTKFSRWRNLALVTTIIFAVIGVVAYLSIWGTDRDVQANRTEPLVVGDSIDPIRDFANVRDNGTVDQLERLLLALRGTAEANVATIVKLDFFNKTIDIADRILDHADRTEAQRALAASTKLNAIWNASRTNTEHGFDNSVTLAQLSGATSELIHDSNVAVARDAHVFQTMGLIVESAGNRFSGSLDGILNSLARMLERYPDDPVVLKSLRSMFPSIRAAQAEQASKLANQILEEIERSDTPKSRELSRYMKDIMLLYDAGIGNAPKIDSIKVGDDEFLQRLTQLNSNLDAGETLVYQLDNAIDYFERQRQFDKALELSQQVLAQSAKRTDLAGAALAKTIGENGVARNSLIQHKWSFEELDAQGIPIDATRLSGRVTLIAFYVAQDRHSVNFLKAFQSLGTVLTGRDVEFIFVEIDTVSETVTSVDAVDNRWSTLKTSLTAPNRYLQQCPTNRFPYLVLIDKSGNVDSINVSLIEAKTAIEYLLSKE